MEKLFMSSGIVIAIVLCIVGLLKTPFKRFKEKHPNGYKAVFTGVSLMLAIVLSILNELYVLNGKLLSLDFAILVCAVFAGVFGGYNAYEGLGVKKLVQTIVNKLKQARSISNDKKVVKYLNKIEDIEKAMKILEERKILKDNENGEV